MASSYEHLVDLDLHDVPSDTEIRIPILNEEVVECRICREEEQQFQLEAPCACSGSVKYAHRKCVQRWCNIKGNTVCEICNQDFKGGYTVIRLHIDNEEIEFGRNTDPRWGCYPCPGLYRYPEEAHGSLQASSIEEYFPQLTTKSGLVFCCGSASFVLMALVFLQHFISIVEEMDGDNSSVLVMIHLVRVFGFLLLCYITVGAIRILHRTSQRWEHEEVVGRREAVVYLAFFASSFTFFFSQCFR